VINMSNPPWILIAEKAAKETDQNQLARLIAELCEVLSVSAAPVDEAHAEHSSSWTKLNSPAPTVTNR